MPGPQVRSCLSLTAKFLLIACSAATSLSAQITPRTEVETIQGLVLNRLTREPIARALVYSPDNRFGTMTDARGRFAFEIPTNTQQASSDPGFVQRTIVPTGGPNRPYSLMARKPGFLPMENDQQVQLSAGENDVTLDVTLYLLPEAFIVGRVSLSNPEKIGLQLYRRQVQDGRARWVPMKSAQTKSDGEFRFAELAPGAYKLFTQEFLDRDPLTFDPRGQLYGYPPVYYPSANNFVDAGTINLEAGGTFHANFSPERQEYYPVQVNVLNLPGAVGMEIEVSVAGQGAPGYSLGYNMEEQRIEGMLPNGTYTIEVSTFGQGAVSGIANITVAGAPAKGQSIALVPNPSLSVKLSEEFTAVDPNNAQEHFGTISSQVIVSDGGGRNRGRYVQVSLEPADEFGRGQGASLRPPASPEDESLVLESVKPGRYWVRVDSPRGYAASVSSGGVNLLQRPLVVATGASAPPIELVMRDDGAQIEGKVEGMRSFVSSVSRSQQPAYGYLIPPPDSSGQLRQFWISPDGSFVAQQIPPGEYRVLAFDRAQPQLEYRDEETIRRYESKGPFVRLPPGQKDQLRLRLIAEAE